MEYMTQKKGCIHICEGIKKGAAHLVVASNPTGENRCSIKGASMEKIDSNSAVVSIQNGFTLIELMIVLLITAVLSVMAMPSFLQWRQNIEFRKTTRDLVSILREAKSRAIRTNLEHRVEYAAANKQYRMTQGNRSNNSTSWNTVVYDWTELPPGVRIDANVNTIQMNTNGTANGGTICIQNDALKTVYEIRVARTGRIRIPAFY
jgi:prepilin-type N-terminal cleavage/methylation domain-containing protein